MSGAFFPLVFIYFYCYYFYYFFILVFNCFFNNKNNSFFAHGYVPLVINAKRIAVGLFQCSLAKMVYHVCIFIFLYLTPSSAARFLNFEYAKICTQKLL